MFVRFEIHKNESMHEFAKCKVCKIWVFYSSTVYYLPCL